MPIDDVARFGAGEEDAIVRASLACPYCLRAPAHVLVVPQADGGEALCACETCRRQWTVVLNADQALRLSLAPPKGLWLQLQRVGGGLG